MPAAPFWEEVPDPWNVLVLGSFTLPGITSLSGGVGRKMDTRSRPGSDGARVRDRGYEPAELHARNRVWTAEQFEQLQAVLNAVHPRRVATTSPARRSARLAAARRELNETVVLVGENPDAAPDVRSRLETLQKRVDEEERAAAQPAAAARGSRRPVDVAHPQLAMLGIRAVYVKHVSVPELDRDGAMVTNITLIEWTEQPAPAPRPATGSGGLEGIETAFDNARDEREPTATPPGRVVGRGAGAARRAGLLIGGS